MRELFKLALIGPNRRSDRTVIEQLFELEEDEITALSTSLGELHQAIRSHLRMLGSAIDETFFPAHAIPGEPANAFAWMYAVTAISLQRSAGHDVSLIVVPERDNPAQSHAVFEHEEVEVGGYAGELALCVLTELCPDLDWRPEVLDPAMPLKELHTGFMKFAIPKVLPAATQAIVNATARLDVPCIKLERAPYGGVQGGFRIRQNSMLMLGHGRYRHLVDGTLCIDKSQSLLPIVKNPHALRGRVSGLLSDSARQADPAWGQHTLFVADHRPIGTAPAAEPHPSIFNTAVQASRLLGAGLLSMTVQTPDISQRLEDAGGIVTNVNPAPQLDDLLPRGSAILGAVAEAFVRWMFPEGSTSRIPVVAVTGTNGKTTTSRMIGHIMQTAGNNTALRCSDGSYFNGREIDLSDAPEVDPYFMQFESPKVDVAVQESHFGMILRTGFPYLKSSVAVCTNVTTDHIGRLGVETVEQMAEVKRAVLERAGDAVVLNADDEHCRAMIPHLGAGKICLVTTVASASDLRDLAEGELCLCVLEEIDGRGWIVLHDDGRKPFVAVDEIPATFGGTAICNVYNAMQAIAACHVLGVDFENMRRALGTFRMEMDMAMGRFNIYDGHPFTVVLDFAHNADGIRRIGEFLDEQGVQGRKIMLIAAAGERSDIDIREKGRAAAEYFDHFVVRSYPDPRGRGREEIVGYMSGFLMDAGVSESAITGVPDPDEGTRAILEMAREGDWLVMNWGNGEAERMWEAITSFRPELG
jgi:UDP-N-acetylmuramyl tripeptide synthase